MAYYRTITPPTPCIAFRVRVDHEEEEGKERVMLATAGEAAVYIFDLEERAVTETIKLHPDLHGETLVRRPLFPDSKADL